MPSPLGRAAHPSATATREQQARAARAFDLDPTDALSRRHLAQFFAAVDCATLGGGGAGSAGGRVFFGDSRDRRIRRHRNGTVRRLTPGKTAIGLFTRTGPGREFLADLDPCHSAAQPKCATRFSRHAAGRQGQARPA